MEQYLQEDVLYRVIVEIIATREELDEYWDNEERLALEEEYQTAAGLFERYDKAYEFLIGGFWEQFRYEENLSGTERFDGQSDGAVYIPSVAYDVSQSDANDVVAGFEVEVTKKEILSLAADEDVKLICPLREKWIDARPNNFVVNE